MTKDTILYDLLGVASNSEENQIIVAYYEKAEKYHPDNLQHKDDNCVNKFNEIKFAYDILSNNLKRKFYDENGFEATKLKYEKNEEDFNYDNYNSQNYYADLLTHNDSNFYQNKKYTKNLVFPLKVSLKDLYRGAKKNFDYQVQTICKVCKGTGTTNQNEKSKCSKCGDKKEKINEKIREICSECEEFQDKRFDDCKNCAGKKTVLEYKKVKVAISKGMYNRQKIAFSGLSHQKPGYETGDLIFILEQSKHDTFKRIKDNLIMLHTINLNEALCGFKFLFRHLDGRIKVVTHPGGEYIHNQTIKCIPKLGMPRINSSEFGDLLIKFDVKFPDSKTLNLEKIKILENLLPPKRELKFNEEENIEEVTSNHVDKDFFENEESDDEIKYAVDENLPEEAFVIKDETDDCNFPFNGGQRIECNNQ